MLDHTRYVHNIAAVTYVKALGIRCFCTAESVVQRSGKLTAERTVKNRGLRYANTPLRTHLGTYQNILRKIFIYVDSWYYIRASCTYILDHMQIIL